MLDTDRYSGYIWDYHLPDQTAPTLLSALKHLLRTLERQLQCKPAVIECDNEIPDSHQRLTEAEVPQGSSINLDASTQEEDEELSALPEGLAFEREVASHPPEGLERDLTITQGENGRKPVAGGRNRDDPDGTDHLYTTARFAPT
ncbi:hypothetical protein FVEN_g12390 [Fusarium venenatum]|nr:hypothetical protein FVEN_g12390 [Fusarium venenatum]